MKKENLSYSGGGDTARQMLIIYGRKKIKKENEQNPSKKDLLQVGGQASERFYLSRANSAS